jgi:hypothetical protein
MSTLIFLFFFLSSLILSAQTGFTAGYEANQVPYNKYLCTQYSYIKRTEMIICKIQIPSLKIIQFKKYTIWWQTDPLLGNDREKLNSRYYAWARKQQQENGVFCEVRAKML